MKSILIKAAIFLLGGTAGFFVGKKVYEGYYAALAEEEIESVKETYQNRVDALRKLIPEAEGNGMTDEEYESRAETVQPKRNNISSLTRSSLDVNANERAKRNYHLAGMGKAVDPNPAEEDDEEEEEGPFTDAAGMTEEEMDLTQVDRTQPYIIDDREFMEEFDHHDKESLYYYKGDDVLCDEKEEIITDIEGTVGYDALAAFDQQTTVWVRNEPLCIDYEIISVNGTYAEMVHGLKVVNNMSPREKYLKEKKAKENHEG